MWVDPMLLAMNWGAALLMALGLGIVYWHATRDTGAPCLWPLALASCTGMQPEAQVRPAYGPWAWHLYWHATRDTGSALLINASLVAWRLHGLCVSRCMPGTKSVWCVCSARSVSMCDAILQAFSSILKSVLCRCKAHTGSYLKLYKPDHSRGKHRAALSRPS